MALFGTSTPSRAANFSNGKVSISDPTISKTGVTYDIEVDGQTAALIRCITARFTKDFGAVDPVPGMSVTSAALAGSSDFVPTPASWSVSTSDATGTITLTNAAGEIPAGGTNRNLVFTSITNGSTKNVNYWVEISSYSDVGCTAAVDNGFAVFVLTDGVLIKTNVAQVISFSLAAGSCSLGVLSTSTTKSCTVGMSASTNAPTGYSISYTADGTLRRTSPTSSVTQIGTTAASSAIGTDQFGFNLVANTTPSVGSNPSGGTGTPATNYNTPNYFAFNSTGAVIATTTGPTLNTDFVMSFIANINSGNVAGDYTAKQSVLLTANP